MGTSETTSPNFSSSMGGALAEPLYHSMIEELKQLYDPAKIQDGMFGAMMDVALINDGPVTIQIDSRDR
ncbi:hypothetical protein SARC_11838 [Sphaeroforma arctica JP610]|uniref:D-aminoacyl-tRNA deacylase n=1 Tax=Sphaeroforma arctica JP610 TaxID=667725 RepID=A0A0L0FFU2_9EUKA|nr:hypothetical protein SARC_11838 [Sphaeroforma arctica JP610]KNC75642.1 hypothetical protein SARC_11838 [Sphaeroforma arctica JP610]|eukprot:XP_014149544.1 hypothetical protein SARC_11838 [Sphaeroforma arctica JP610]